VQIPAASNVRASHRDRWAFGDPDRVISQLHLLYSCPTGFEPYLRRLEACVAAFGRMLEVTRIDDAQTLVPRAAFVSATQPTLLLLDGGDLIAEAIGDLSAHELRCFFAS
jgi:hypothetical protein